jgi:hypothetical protein
MARRKLEKKAITGSEIERIARQKGFDTFTVIPHRFAEIEYLAVKLETFKTAFFLMDNETFKFRYSHTYNAKTDKTSRRTPNGF